MVLNFQTSHRKPWSEYSFCYLKFTSLSTNTSLPLFTQTISLWTEAHPWILCLLHLSNLMSLTLVDTCYLQILFCHSFAHHLSDPCITKIHFYKLSQFPVFPSPNLSYFPKFLQGLYCHVVFFSRVLGYLLLPAISCQSYYVQFKVLLLPS